MLILNDWHPDVFEFINSKREAGKITNANISVGVSDRLMAAVEADGDWDLVFPDTHHPDYDAEWNGDLDTWMGKGYPVVVHRTVKARAVWDAIVESAWASAEPGVFFNERYNKMSNSHYFAPIIATNPCVTGETRLYTDKGLVRVIDLFNDETQIEVTIDGRFGLPNATTPSTRVFRTGRKPVFRLTTREGYSIRATADHRFMTPGGWAELQDLQPGDSVHVLNRKGGFGTQGSLEEGRILGWLTGDGTVKHDKGEVVLSFFGDEKQELAPLFAEYVNAIVEPMTATRRAYPVGVGVVTGRDEARVTSMRLYDALKPTGICDAKLRVPEAVFQGTEAMQRGYLQALFTADGGSQGTVATSLSVRLASSEPELLEQVQMLLSNFGILSRIYRNRRPEMERMMPDGKGGKKAYLTRSQHEIHISQDSVVRFQREIGFLTERKNRLLADRLSAYKVGPRAALFVAQVESITPDGVEDVFDVTEPITHSIVANSLVIHNCGEQGLPGFGVCNLGAINLAKFYDADTHDVAWDQLDRAVRYATRFLDNVIDTTFYFIDENKVQQTGERRVGLNNMGLAELMIRLGIRYGSDESLAFIDRLYGLIARASYETSIELAREKGAFPMFQAEPFLRSGFMQTMPEDIREGVRRYGIRNVTLLTQAPNGTTGTMVNTSTGIEPFFSWVYYRKSRLGLHEEQVPIARDWFEANPGATALPDYFVTAMDLTPEEHVHVQAAIQRWVDSSISKTSNLPNHYTVEQTRAFYEYLYKLGCKGGTVYRDGSRDEQVLMLKGDERAEKEMEAKASAAGETPAPAAAANGHAPVPANGAANGHASAPANGAASSDGAASTGAANGGVLAHEPIRIAPRQPEAVDPAATPHRVYPRPRKLSGTTVSTRTAFGTAYVTMNSDENGCPFEVFITAPGKGGSDLQADAEGLGRMISLQLRTTAPHNRMAMLRLIVEQLQGIGGARAYGLGANRVLSLPDAVARVLADQYLQVPAEQQLDLFTPPEVQVSGPIVGTPTISTPVHGTPVLATPTLAAYTAPVSSSGYASGADVCPSCGTVSLLRVDGCRKCSTCGYSEC
jgi:ribonucleoside-diphosphate reductase alpha chain